MTEFVRYLVLTCVFVVLLSLLRQYDDSIALPGSLCMVVFLLGVSISVLIPVFEFLKEILLPDNHEYVSILLKAIGISLWVSTATDICRASGEEGIALKVELLGKSELLVLALPLMKKILELIKRLAETWE